MEAEEGEKYKRPSWDEYFIEIMEAISRRGSCDRGRSGCVIAKNKQIISAGYVGSAAGDDHCDAVGHLFQKRLNADGSISNHCVRTVHAEQNAICQAAKNGTPIDGATLYCKMTPCPVCAKMIVNCGIKRVVCQKRYHDGREAERIFSKTGVALVHMTEDEENYANKGDKIQDKKDEQVVVAQVGSPIPIKIKKLKPEAVIPSYAYDNDAGMDLYSTEEVEIPAGSRAKISTGIAIELPEGYASLIWDKSGVSIKKGLTTIGGVIDSGYRGEYIVAIANISRESVTISRGEKIAQVLIQKVEKAQIEISEELADSERSEKGFGSSDFRKIDPIEDLGLDYLPEEYEPINDEDDLEVEESAMLNKVENKEGKNDKSRW